MTQKKAELILHPVRMRIIQALVNGHKLTRQQLNEILPDIPQATMYRHLNKLEQAGLINVVEEHKYRGSIERVYAIEENAGSIPLEEVAEMSREELMELFMKFLSGLIGDFSRYLEKKQIDPVQDGISFRQIPLYLDEEEFLHTVKDLRTTLQQRASNSPTPQRRRRLFTTIIIPDLSPEQE